MAQASSSTNVPGGNQGAPTLNANNGATNVYMMRSDAHLQTRAPSLFPGHAPETRGEIRQTDPCLQEKSELSCVYPVKSEYPVIV
jgi:hypothetical protein